MKPYILALITAFCFFLIALATTFLTDSSGKVFESSPRNANNTTPDLKFIENVAFEEVWAVNEHLANPNKLIVRKRIFVQDYSGKAPIPVFTQDGQFVRYISNWGRGSGEINLGYKLSGDIGKKLIVFDDQTSKLLTFEIATGNVSSEKVLPINDPIIADQLLISRTSTTYPAFAFGIRVDENLNILGDTLLFGKYEHFPELSPAKKNWLLKQGPTAVDKKGNIFFAFHDATLILGFSNKGKLIFKTAKPYDKSTLPEFIKHRAAPGAISAPNRDEYPKHYIGLAADDKYIYGLYSGFMIKTRQDLLNAEKLNEGNLLHIFKKDNSEYIGTVKLPYPVRDIYIGEDVIYALTVNPEPKLVKFRKPKIFS